MTKNMNETLSAFVDDETDELETRKVIDQIAQDKELRDKWFRYHLVRGVIKGTLVSSGRVDRFWKALDNDGGREQTGCNEHVSDNDLGGGLNNQNRFARFMGLGIAATVVLVVNFYYPDQNESAPRYSESVGLAVPPVSTVAPPERNLTNVQSYMKQHARHSSAVNRVRPIPVSNPATFSDGQKTSEPRGWQVGWIPDGFKITSVDALPHSNIKRDMNMMMYSDGLSAFSVFVESMPEVGAGDWVSQDGATVVVRTPVSFPNQKLVTVVGEVSTPTATRIARSIHYPR